MKNMLFDTHAHYFDEKFDTLEGGAEALLGSEGFKSRICGVINVGTSYESSLSAIKQAKKYDFMYASVGIHPEDAQTKCKLSPDAEIERIRGLIYDTETRAVNKIVAVGEIGFDYYWKPVDRELQYQYFDKQMALAKELDLPVIIHDRDAHGDTFDMICKHKNVRGVLHSCSMSAEMVKEIVKLGWYISFAGPLTYKNAERVREACLAAPLDRLLIETDAPYLSPVPYRGQINSSLYMESTAAKMAELFGMETDEIAEITAQNAKELFGL